MHEAVAVRTMPHKVAACLQCPSVVLGSCSCSCCTAPHVAPTLGRRCQHAGFQEPNKLGDNAHIVDCRCRVHMAVTVETESI
jgi:hypothetical protein